MLRRNLFRKSINLYKGKLRYAIFPLFFVVGSSVLLWFFLVRNPLLTIKSVRVEPEKLSLVSIPDVKSVLENRFLNKSIFFKKSVLKSIVSANFPAIKNVSCTISFPSALIVSLEQRIPSAYIKTNLQKGYFISDSEGFILGVSTVFDGDMPLINYTGNMIFSGGQLPDNKVVSALNFLSELQDVNMDIGSCAVGDAIVVTLRNPKIEVIVSPFSPERRMEKVVILQKLLQKYSIEGRRVRRVDLRFSNPIIDFW